MAGTHPCDSLGLHPLFPGEISSHETNKFLAETSSEGSLACESDTPTTTLSASSNDPDSFTQSQGECLDSEAATISLCLTKLNGDVTALASHSRPICCDWHHPLKLIHAGVWGSRPFSGTCVNEILKIRLKAL